MIGVTQRNFLPGSLNDRQHIDQRTSADEINPCQPRTVDEHRIMHFGMRRQIGYTVDSKLNPPDPAASSDTASSDPEQGDE